MTLMSSDVEDVVDSLAQLHEVWVSPIELGVGLYLLSTKVGPAAVLVAVPLLCKFLPLHCEWKLMRRSIHCGVSHCRQA